MDAQTHIQHLVAAAGLQQMNERRFGLRGCHRNQDLVTLCDWLQIYQRAQELDQHEPAHHLGSSFLSISERINTL